MRSGSCGLSTGGELASALRLSGVVLVLLSATRGERSIAPSDLRHFT